MKKLNIAELAEKAYRLGKEYEKTYRGCSQSVIAALQDTLEIRNDDIFKSTTGLAGGTSPQHLLAVGRRTGERGLTRFFVEGIFFLKYARGDWRLFTRRTV